MKKMTLFDETFSAERITKTDTSVIGYDADTEVFCFNNIKDFTPFILEEGAAWDNPSPSQEEVIARLSKRLDESENAILGLIEMNMMGGGF